MLQINKLMQGLGIPFAALVSVLFGLMILSFPLGAYVVFNSDIQDEINYDYPLDEFSSIIGGMDLDLPIVFELGDVFISIWAIFVILFTIAMFGPKTNFLRVLSSHMTEGKYDTKSNYLVSIIKWFSILIVVSLAIDLAQENVGIITKPPEAENPLIQFFNVSISPITEEIGFRVILIGLPLFAIYSYKSSFRNFFASLWHPTQNLHIYETKSVLIIVILVGIFFGAAHIIFGESWSFGKLAQATASGIIIGWVYIKHGLISAILLHWSANYFVFSYVYFLADINEISIKAAFSHSLTTTLEILLVVLGIISIGIVLADYFSQKNAKRIETS